MTLGWSSEEVMKVSDLHEKPHRACEVHQGFQKATSCAHGHAPIALLTALIDKVNMLSGFSKEHPQCHM